MEFTLQSYEILIIALVVMGLLLAVIPAGHGDPRLKGYKISLIFMAMSFVSLGAYCLFKARLPRELLFFPFFISSHIQVCLLGLAHLNLINPNIVHRRQVLLNFCPMLACALIYAAVQAFCPFVRLSSWTILFHSLSNPGVIVRILWLLVYIAQILYYAVVFFREEKKYSRALGNYLSGMPGAKYRLALFSFIGAQLAGIDSVCICLTLDMFMGGIFNLIMLGLYAFMCVLFVQYPSIFAKISGVITETQGNAPQPLSVIDWPSLKKKIVSERLFVTEGLTLDQLAGELGVSRQTLSRSVNAEEGVNFNTFIGGLRISEAQAIMKNRPELTLSEIGSMVGYSEQSNFSRQFKAVTGFTPGEYRKNI